MRFFWCQPEAQLSAFPFRQLRERRDYVAAGNSTEFSPPARTPRLDGTVAVEFDRDDPIQGRTRIAAHDGYVSVSWLLRADDADKHSSASGL